MHQGIRGSRVGAVVLLAVLASLTLAACGSSGSSSSGDAASLLKRTVGQLARFRDRLRLDGVFYFNWRDASPPPGAGDHWGLHTGLFRQDGSPKPAFQALTEVTASISSG